MKSLNVAELWWLMWQLKAGEDALNTYWLGLHATDPRACSYPWPVWGFLALQKKYTVYSCSEK